MGRKKAVKDRRSAGMAGCQLGLIWSPCIRERRLTMQITGARPLMCGSQQKRQSGFHSGSLVSCRGFHEHQRAKSLKERKQTQGCDPGGYFVAEVAPPE